MPQTQASKDALLRDNNTCQWCLHREHRIRSVFAYVEGYHPMMGGGHHVFKRRNVDEAEAIISLCAEHHQMSEEYKIPKREIVELLSEIAGVDLYTKYREFCKW